MTLTEEQIKQFYFLHRDTIFPQLLPLQERLDRWRHLPILRNLGYGSVAVLRKR